MKASPADPALMISLAQATEDRSEAKSLARKAALRSPASSAAWAYLLEICQKCGQESEAVDAARSLVLRRPHDVEAHLRLAEMLHREDQCNESLRVIADAMQIDRRSPEVHHLFARRLFEQKFYEKALEACSPPEVYPYELKTLNLLSTRIM